MTGSLSLWIGEKNTSSWSMRAYLMLKIKGLEFEERHVSLAKDKDRAQRLRIAPTGRVPVLQHGDLVIPDSLAILEYLEETFPPPGYPALWPSDPRDRSHARWLSAEMHAGFTGVRTSMAFQHCFHRAKPVVPPEAREEALRMMGLWEAALTKGNGGPFLFGPFGGVDAMFAPAVVRLVSFEIPSHGTPLAARYMSAVMEDERVASWMDAARALPPYTG